MNSIGKVYLVGAGCGDYDLITLRGKLLLQQCDAVVYDSLIDKRLLDIVPEGAEKICVGKRAGCIGEAQENINKILVEKALEGKTTVRLKGGDPFVFGRGGEEALALKEQNIEYGIVPGISSSIAVPELAGIPVTHRGVSRSVHIITGHTAENCLPENMEVYAKLDGTLVFLMGLKNLRKITNSLILNGKSEATPTAVVSNGASANQRLVRGTLGNISDKAENSEVKSPAIIIIGEAAGLDFSQTISLPLKHTSVTVTGTQKFASRLSAKLEKLGADIHRLDYLNVLEYRNNPQFDKALLNLNDYGWVVLTSVNGAEIFFNRLARMKIDIRKLFGVKFAVIGSGTAKLLEKHGIFPELIPKSYTSSSLAEKLSEEVSQGERVLILRAEQGSKELTKILDEKNISYEDIKTYNVLNSIKTFESREIDTDYITFASSSGVKAFFDNGFNISPKTKIISIGEITAGALREHGVNDFAISATCNIEGVAEKIVDGVLSASK